MEDERAIVSLNVFNEEAKEDEECDDVGISEHPHFELHNLNPTCYDILCDETGQVPSTRPPLNEYLNLTQLPKSNKGVVTVNTSASKRNKSTPVFSMVKEVDYEDAAATKIYQPPKPHHITV